MRRARAEAGKREGGGAKPESSGAWPLSQQKVLLLLLFGGGSWLAQLVESVTLDLGVVTFEPHTGCRDK